MAEQVTTATGGMTESIDPPAPSGRARPACSCWRTAADKVEVIPFGADLHLRHVARRGPPWWWVWAGVCDHCGQHWLVGQEERLGDVYLLRKLDDAETAALNEQAVWPTSFDRYATLLTLCEAAGHSWRNWDRSDTSALGTAHVLRQECPGITIEEIVAVLGLGPADVRQVIDSFDAVDPRSA